MPPSETYHLPAEEDVLARFSTRSFTGHPALTIALAVFGSLFVLQIALLFDLHPFVLTGILLGTMLLVFGRLAGHAHYVLTVEGIHQEVSPFLPLLGGREPRRRFLPLAAVKGHRADSTLTRQGDPVQRLFVDLEVAPRRLSLNDQHDAAGFVSFRDALVALLDASAR